MKRETTMAMVLAVSFMVAGCGLSRERLITFQSSDYVLYGQVLRQGQPLPRQAVKLYNDLESVLFDSVLTDESGHYGFDNAPTGDIMVKVTSIRPGEFRYVRYILNRTAAGQRDSVPPLDLFAYGCHAVLPETSARLPAPSPSSPIDFTWTPMTLPGTIKYRARISDPSDELVWESTRDIGSDATFNGLGTSGTYAGVFVAGGTFYWRVKVRLPNNVSAATEERLVVFTPDSTGIAS